MELNKVADDASGIIDTHADDSTIYLFGSELYCGWCLEAFTCPVRLKIHCHIEHLLTCACGEEFCSKETLIKHAATVGCILPQPFQWSHFVNLPCGKPNEVNDTGSPEDKKQHQELDENDATDKTSPNKSVKGPDESVQKANASEIRKASLKKDKKKANKESRLQALKNRKFCCGLCPFESVFQSACNRHIRQKHGKQLAMERSQKTPEKQQDCSTVDDKAVIDTLSKTSAIDEPSTENASDGKSECVNVSVANSEACCEKHTSDDIQFVVSCFSSPSGGKPLCCDLCPDKFGMWEQAALHVYGSHFPALQQWRDSRANLTDIQPSCEDKAAEKSADGTADDQPQILSTAAECDVPKSDDGVCSETVIPNVSEEPSVKSEHDRTDTSVDQSKIHRLENETKCKFTTDKCKALASSICRLLSCEPGHKREQALVEEVAATASSPTKELSTASASSPTKSIYTEMAAASKLISRRCKFCHRVYSNRYNCRRHEAVCRLEGPSSESAKQSKRSLHKEVAPKETEGFSAAVRVVHDSKIFYCARCGFSDSDQRAVYSHLMKPHVFVGGKLCLDAQPGNDYIGSMRIGAGKFRCSLCGLHKQFRSKLLKHMLSHSSPAVPPGNTLTVEPESLPDKLEESSLPDKVEESTEKHGIGIAPASSARSCPKCSKSFASIAKYLQHRAVCRAVQHCQEIPHHQGITPHTVSSRDHYRRFHYLFSFCEQSSDGRWRCKLCKCQSMLRVKNVFSHIRTKHETVQKAEMEASVSFSKQRADGVWQCNLCKRSCAFRHGMYRHIRVTHAAQIGEKLASAKLNDVTDFCVKTAKGLFQCRLCECSFSHRSNIYRHIRKKHTENLLPIPTESNAIPSTSGGTISSSSVAKHVVKKTSVLSVRQKSLGAKHLVKRCPTCSRTLTSIMGYHNHTRICQKLGLDRFIEELPTGRLRCRLCQLTYSTHSDCRKHLCRKHRSSGKLTNIRRDCMGLDIKTEDPVAVDDSMNDSSSDKNCGHDNILDKSAIKTEN